MLDCGMRLFRRKTANKRRERKPPIDQKAVAAVEQDPWLLQSVHVPDCTSLVLRCIDQLKGRALHVDQLMSAFSSDPRAARSLLGRILSRYSSESHQIVQLGGGALDQELHISEPHALVGILRWVLSRVPNGIVNVQKYRIWRRFEEDTPENEEMFSDGWHLLIGDEDRSLIFDAVLSLLASVCSHARHNGHDVEELIRSSSLWLFPNTPTAGGAGFMVGYQTYASQSQAMMHIFLGSLREQKQNSKMPLALSLEKMLEATTYPPEGPVVRETTKLVLSSTAISKSPLALLRRAAQHKTEADSAVLRTFTDDPSKGFNLCESSLRILATMQSMLNSREQVDIPNWNDDKDAWVQFRDLGFQPKTDVAGTGNILKRYSYTEDRPRTLDWGQFMQAGFHPDANRQVSNDFLPPQLRLPQTDVDGRKVERDLTSVKVIDLRVLELDASLEAAWCNSLAYETSQALKGFFGRSVVLRLRGHEDAWLVCEEVMPNQPRQDVMSGGSDFGVVTLKADAEWLAAAERRLNVLSQLRRGSKMADNDHPTPLPALRDSATVTSMPSAHTDLKAAAAWLNKYDSDRHLEEQLVDSEGNRGTLRESGTVQAPVVVPADGGSTRPKSFQAALDATTEKTVTTSVTATPEPSQALRRKPSIMKRIGTLVRRPSAPDLQKRQENRAPPMPMPVSAHQQRSMPQRKPMPKPQKFHPSSPRQATGMPRAATAPRIVADPSHRPQRPKRESYHSMVTDVSDAPVSRSAMTPLTYTAPARRPVETPKSRQQQATTTKTQQRIGTAEHKDNVLTTDRWGRIRQQVLEQTQKDHLNRAGPGQNPGKYTAVAYS